MNLKGKYTHIFFDADDTLWENEQFFREAEAQFAALLSDYTSPEGLQHMLFRHRALLRNQFTDAAAAFHVFFM